MSLTDLQVQQLREALVRAFDEPQLAQMVRSRLGENLSTMADGDNLGEFVSNLIAGPSLETVRIALHHDTELQELAHSPLMLNIMTLAYQGVAAAELHLDSATQTRRQHLFNTYVQHMFVRREIKPIYSALQTVRWLQRLATRLVQSGQTIFLIERMRRAGYK